MGNRAVIILDDANVGVYLHYYGGPESVLGFLAAAKELGLQCSGDSYDVAAFVRLVHGFRDNVSVGVLAIAKPEDADHGDNGCYHIAGDWTIARREFVDPKAWTRPEQLDAQSLAQMNSVKARAIRAWKAVAEVHKTNHLA